MIAGGLQLLFSATALPIYFPLPIPLRSVFFLLRFFLVASMTGLASGWISSGRAATTLTDLHLQGTGNQIASGAELTITSGGTLTGATDGIKAAPGTIRGDLSTSGSRNLVHASDSAESAAREIALWFPHLP